MTKKHRTTGMNGDIDINAIETLEQQGIRDIIADIEAWKSIVRSRGRDVLIQDLLHGEVFAYLGSDRDHKLYIKATNEAEIRALLDSYTDSEFGEWFSLMTSIVLYQTIMQTGMLWKMAGKRNPLLLACCPPLEELRSTIGLTKGNQRNLRNGCLSSLWKQLCRKIKLIWRESVPCG